MSRIFRLIFDSLVPAICVLGIIYNCLLALNGDEGIRARNIVQANLDEKKQELEILAEQRQRLALKADQLSSSHLDKDRLDESARRVLGYAGSNEVVIPMSEFEKVIDQLSRE